MLILSAHLVPRAQDRYEEGYGTVLDSGTTFTYLPSDAFAAFKDAVSAFALEHGLRSVKGPDPKVNTRPSMNSEPAIARYETVVTALELANYLTGMQCMAQGASATA